MPGSYPRAVHMVRLGLGGRLLIASRVPEHDYTSGKSLATGKRHAFTARDGFTGCVWCGEAQEHLWHGEGDGQAG